MSILRYFADALEQGGIDEAYLDVTKKTHGSYEGSRNARYPDESSCEERSRRYFLSRHRTNMLIAKIASDIHKPDGVTTVRPEQVEAFLPPMPVDALLGVGKKTVAKMSEMGIQPSENSQNMIFNVSWRFSARSWALLPQRCQRSRQHARARSGRSGNPSVE